MILIDTDVAIHLRDDDRETIARIGMLSSVPALSIMSLVELENGVHTKPALSETRRSTLDAMLRNVEIVGFDRAVVSAYGAIVASVRHSRPRTIDRLIAATAIVHGMTLVTMNGADFREIPGLALEIWPAPTA